MKIPKSVANLIEAFEALPGIGPKSAARLTYYLLHAPDTLSQKLSSSLADLKVKTKICSICQNITEIDPCEICEDQNRDRSMICVVEDPLDVWAIEKSGSFPGLYHVLHGVIAPLENVGPEDLKIQELLVRLKGRTIEVKELILATNPSMEGEATAMYIQRLISSVGLPAGPPAGRTGRQVKITRIARGIPIGAELEYADEVTVRRALEGRKEF